MKSYDWSSDKNEWLKEKRGISFEKVVTALDTKRFLDDIDHPNKDKYPNQRIWVVEIQGYAYLVPYVEDNKKYFLKTVVPSHKATKKYIDKRKDRV